MHDNKLEKNVIPYTNIMNKPNNIELKINSELNNKLSLECSYLINEIKRKNKTLLAPLNTNKKRLFIKKSIISEKHKNLISKNSSNNPNEISNFNRFEQFSSKINLPKMLDNSSKSISLTSLFNLPKVKTRNRINIRQKVVKNNNFSINLHKKQAFEQRYDKKDNFFGIHNFMKEKFYSDVESKCKSEIKTKYFRNDSAIKDEIIAVKKFGVFWSRFIDYCQPIIKYKEYQLSKKYSNKNSDIKEMKLIKSSSMINSKINRSICN